MATTDVLNRHKELADLIYFCIGEMASKYQFSEYISNACEYLESGDLIGFSEQMNLIEWALNKHMNYSEAYKWRRVISELLEGGEIWQTLEAVLGER